MKREKTVKFNLLCIFRESDQYLSIDMIEESLKTRNIFTVRKNIDRHLSELVDMGLIHRAYRGVYSPGVRNDEED